MSDFSIEYEWHATALKWLVKYKKYKDDVRIVFIRYLINFIYSNFEIS